MVNYYAPWCHWCARLKPVWEHTSDLMKIRPNAHKVKLGKVDCTGENSQGLCDKAHVRGYPTIYTYRFGKTQSNKAYNGDRTVDAFMDFVDNLPDRYAKRRGKAGVVFVMWCGWWWGGEQGVCGLVCDDYGVIFYVVGDAYSPPSLPLSLSSSLPLSPSLLSTIFLVHF